MTVFELVAWTDPCDVHWGDKSRPVIFGLYKSKKGAKKAWKKISSDKDFQMEYKNEYDLIEREVYK